jgi:hypothetical protein
VRGRHGAGALGRRAAAAQAIGRRAWKTTEAGRPPVRDWGKRRWPWDMGRGDVDAAAIARSPFGWFGSILGSGPADADSE